MHDAFGDPLVVEVLDLLDEREVFEQRGAPLAGAQRVLVVGNRHAGAGGEGRPPRVNAKWIELVA